MRYFWTHVLWFLGLAQIIVGALAATTDMFTPQQLKIIILIAGILPSVIGYIKSNPPDPISPKV